MTTKSLACEKKIDCALLNMAGGFCFHLLGLLPNGPVNNGGHAVRDADIAPDVYAGISFVADDTKQGFRFPGTAAGRFHALAVQLAADPGGGPAGTIQIEYMTDNGGAIRIQRITTVRAAPVADDPGAVIQAAVRIVRHAARYVFRKLAGIPFSGGFEHAFQQDTGGAVRNWFHGVQDFDTVTAKTAFEQGGFFPVPSEPVDLPANHGVKGAGFSSGHHGLKRGSGGGILKTGTGMISVFMYDGKAFPFRKGTDVRQLLLDGNITLARGGIPGISDSGAGRAGRN